jgi:hypothetical protein
MGFPLSGLLLTSLMILPVFSLQKPQLPMPNSPKGFDKQYKSVFKAYEAYEKALNEEMESADEKTLLKGDGYENVLSVYRKIFRKKSAYKRPYSKENELALMERLSTFAVPEHWFFDVFGPEQGPAFAREYEERFRGFESATIREFRRVNIGVLSAQVKTRPVRTNAALISVRLAPTPLLPLPPVQRFRVRHFTAAEFEIGENGCVGISAPGYDSSWVDSFIYVDGAFRFVGRGPCPFWEPCSTKEPFSAGQIVSPMDGIGPD